MPHAYTIMAASDRGDYVLVGNEDDGILMVYNSNGEKISEVTAGVDFFSWASFDYGSFIRNNSFAIAREGKAELYKLSGELLFSNKDNDELVVMNISPRNDQYSVILLKERKISKRIIYPYLTIGEKCVLNRWNVLRE